jgi:hypothetical protein
MNQGWTKTSRPLRYVSAAELAHQREMVKRVAKEGDTVINASFRTTLSESGWRKDMNNNWQEPTPEFLAASRRGHKTEELRESMTPITEQQTFRKRATKAFELLGLSHAEAVIASKENEDVLTDAWRLITGSDAGARVARGEPGRLDPLDPFIETLKRRNK